MMDVVLVMTTVFSRTSAIAGRWLPVRPSRPSLLPRSSSITGSRFGPPGRPEIGRWSTEIVVHEHMEGAEIGMNEHAPSKCHYVGQPQST